MLFSFVNILATFQSYINKYLAKKLDVFCIVYLNNILIPTSKKKTKYKEAMIWILEQLDRYDLYDHLNKSRFNTDKIYFLEYIVSLSKIHIELKRIESIKNWPKLQLIREIKVFIGFVNFYQ